jgi:diphthamide synthase (EF-2-diphthine--ammonia ligase)
VVLEKPLAAIFMVAECFSRVAVRSSSYCVQDADSRSLSNVSSHLQDCRVVSSGFIREEITMYRKKTVCEFEGSLSCAAVMESKKSGLFLD